jgi:hypothetical protein
LENTFNFYIKEKKLVIIQQKEWELLLNQIIQIKEYYYLLIKKMIIYFAHYLMKKAY